MGENILKEKWKYPTDMGDKIIQHEEKMLMRYSEIIKSHYQSLFEKYGCDLNIGLEWLNLFEKCGCDLDIRLEWFKTGRNCRRKFHAGYSCQIYCEVLKDGKEVNVPDYEGDYDFYPLWAVWEISRIDGIFCKEKYVLCTDSAEEICRDMDRLVKCYEEAEANSWKTLEQLEKDKRSKGIKE